MQRDFKLPDLGEGLTEGEVVRWLVTEGEAIGLNHPLVEVETAKATVELPSPFAGKVARLHAREGEMVEVGNTIVTVETSERTLDPAASEPGRAHVGGGPASSSGDAAQESGDWPEGPTLVGLGPRDERRGSRGALARRSNGADTPSGHPHPAPSGADLSTPTSDPGSTRPKATPPVRRYARDRGVELRDLVGTGRDGRITRDDVDAASGRVPSPVTAGTPTVTRVAVTPGLNDFPSRELPAISVDGAPGEDPAAGERDRMTGHPTGREAVQPTPYRPAPAAMSSSPHDAGQPAAQPHPPPAPGTAITAREERDPVAAARALQVSSRVPSPSERALGLPRPVTDRDDQRFPVRGTRRAIAARMVDAAVTIPHATESLTVDATSLMELRQRLRTLPAAQEVKLTPLAVIARAVCVAVRAFPHMNSSWDDQASEIVVKGGVNLGVATDTDSGLMVPNIKHADTLGVLDLAQEINRLAERARTRTATPEDLTGGTITITNIGGYGVEHGTPIINKPECAIVAVGLIAKRPWVVDDQIEIRSVMPVSVTFDHRIVDGGYAARFLTHLRDLLQDPVLLSAF